MDYVLNIPTQKGLANAFKAGIERGLELGADIIVNTDGDNQYKGEDIKLLTKPILEKKADIVVGCRDITAIRHFSFTKKLLQFFGSYVVRKFSNTSIPDATSGFRAYSKDAALKLNIFSNYTYTLETIIQAGRKNIPIAHVNIRVNEKLRESRLIKNVFGYVIRSSINILRIYLMYEPLKVFLWLGTFTAIPGVLLIVRFLYAHFTKVQGGHIQSLIISVVFLIVAFGIIMLGLVGDVLAKNRILSEEVLYKVKKRIQYHSEKDK